MKDKVEGGIEGEVEVQFHSFLTSALVGGQGSTSLSCHFIASKKSSRYTSNRRLGGPQNPYGSSEEKKSLLLLTRIEPWNVQPTAHSPPLH